ncbi:hypothetical protein Poli38472_012162 [Pythium oligandrum]|uniref:AGC/RSK/RSKP90 protein kinase n=1 Tax=Pythium oligandrum TaxID=41045 RepID=A0A8K1CQX7_PYTOL|nr:hypothetical protein Poli38472_012162 [Pythium oligandrum]|eukprot:TMW67046.1 hypothetical protein Poli38472_012162 [Pythium oligandrum]
MDRRSMSADYGNDADFDDIAVTSPTSLARRESMRRSSSGYDMGYNPPPPVPQPSIRATFGGASDRSAKVGRNSLFSRAPPPPPPAHPPQIPGYQNNGSGMPRPSSNPSLAALTEDTSMHSPYHGNSLGPSSLATTPMGSSSSNNTFEKRSSFISRRGGTRKSILSVLSREKETPSAMPEYNSADITCEGFLTKRGHVFTNWKMRYFVLRGNVLDYFADVDKSKRYGSVVVEKVAPWTGEAHGFMFYTSKQVPYYVYASSESERDMWLRALKDYCVEPEEVSCEGYLTRRGHLVPSQRFAYYVLNGTSLRHYTDQAAYRDNHSALAEFEIRSVSQWAGDRFGLMFTTVTGNVFYAIADSQPEQQKWLSSAKRATANIPEPVSCAGYLTKQGHKRKSWKKRYFILRGSQISYFTDYDMANSAKGKPLAEVVVEDVQRWDGEPFGFMFMTNEQVPYYVYADNERERAKWMTALQKLTAVPEEPEVEKKRCPNCNAVLTGSRFCGACGFNLRGTSVNERGAAPAVNPAAVDDRDDLEDENTAFDELEALSEGARTLLLAVMQTPEGIDIGGDNGFPSRLTGARTDDDDEEEVEADITAAMAEARIDEDEEEEYEEPPRSPVAAQPPSPVQTPAPASSDSDSEEAPPSPVARPSKTPEPTKPKLVPNFEVVAASETASFHSFGDSDDEVKAEPKPVLPPTVGGAGKAKTMAQLQAEDSSDDDEPALPTKPPTHVAKTDAEEKEEDEDWPSAEKSRRKSSADSLELDTRGIAMFDEPQEPPKPKPQPRGSAQLSERSSKNDIYHYMEKELDFTPIFVPSADSPVRCRLYSSMAYLNATKVIMFISDSGPLGLWRQDPTDQATTTEHKWSMVRYLSRAQEEGYGIILCNPFSNSAVVYEAGGFEREVPIPNSSTPRDHVHFVWENYASKCKGQVSVIAYARGGALMKSILESHEATAREKIHRIAFIQSKHEIDGNESSGVLELLGRRSINWEASFESQGGQIVDSQARVGCVCLSIGYMPPNSLEPESAPTTLEKSEDPAFAFVNANPDRPGMTAVVKWVRSELRRRRQASTSRTRRNSNIVVLGEADAEETSDVSTGAAEEAKKAALEEEKAKYYLPKPSPKPKPAPTPSPPRHANGNGDKQQISVAKDFDLLQIVGQGGFGKVFLARKRTLPDQGECYAMKVLKKQHVISSGLINTTMAERKILTEIRHPFVVRLHYAFQDASKLYLVMDYLSGGALAAHLRRRRKFPEDWARFYAAEVAAAMAHLHSLNIIYRDAKLENVLLDHDGHVRITDFGLSKVGVSGLNGATTFCGTAAYIAPELLKGQPYGKAADWWSFGILLYEMIGGKPPYYHRNRDIMFQTILKQEWVTFSPNFSDSAVSLIRGLLTRDPTMRLGSGPRGADEVLTHPFFDSISWPDLLEKRIPPPFNPGVGRLDTHYAPRLNNPEITTRDRQGSVLGPGRTQNNDFDGFSFVGRPSSLSRDD